VTNNKSKQAAAPKRVRRPRSASGETWQAEKSKRTRQAILDATIQCCADIGYAKTTTARIAKKAGTSQGAMMHHFKSFSAVIKAAARYVAEKRALEFEEIVAEFNAQSVNVARMHRLVERLVCYYSLPSFVALHELLVAARSDKALRQIFLPLERKLDRRMAEAMRTQFPYLKSIEKTREVLQDVMLFSVQGLTVSPLPYLGKQRLKNMAKFLAGMAVRELALALQQTTEGA